MLKIKRIEINAFRGIPKLDLDLDRKSVVLLGENGSGKSSIVDSIEFFFTGRVLHLEGIKGSSLREHGTHVEFSPRDAQIKISFDPGNEVFRRTFSSVPSPSKPLENYFRGAEAGTFILRRAQILEFINSTPAERFRAIGSMIGIRSLDATELEMKRAEDDLAGEVEFQKQSVEQLLSEISEVVGRDVRTVPEIISALNVTLIQSNLPSINTLEESKEYSKDMLKKTTQKELKTISSLTGVIENADNDFLSGALVSQITTFNTKVGSLIHSGARSELSVSQILGISKELIDREQSHKCPICERRIDPEKISNRISARLSIVKDLSVETSKVRKSSKFLPGTLQETINRIKSIQINAKPYLGPRETSQLQQTIKYLERLSEDIISARDLKTEISIGALKKQTRKMDTLRRIILTELKQLLETYNLTEENERILRQVLLVQEIRTKTEQLVRFESDLEVTNKNYQAAQTIHSAFSLIKKSKIQEIYQNIGGDIQRFYMMLHPNEHHKDLEVIVKRRASTELKIESFGRKGEDPRSLASEGHLDSLGLCIFLAFAKKFTSNCSLLVLDDVVTAIDSGHREAVASLLLEEFEDKQLIITTHDGVWYNQLISAERMRGLNNEFKNIQITNWDPITGPTIRGYKPRWEKIQEEILNGDKVGAGTRGRQYLEWILERICATIGARVGYRSSGRYSVNDLLFPARDRLKSILPDTPFRSTILKSFTDLDKTIMMGNLVSHNNPLATEVVIGEVQRFCSAIRAIHESMSCPTCKNLLGYFQDLKIIRCPNTHCKNPLQMKTR